MRVLNPRENIRHRGVVFLGVEGVLFQERAGKGMRSLHEQRVDFGVLQRLLDCLVASLRAQIGNQRVQAVMQIEFALHVNFERAHGLQSHNRRRLAQNRVGVHGEFTIAVDAHAGRVAWEFGDRLTPDDAAHQAQQVQ